MEPQTPEASGNKTARPGHWAWNIVVAASFLLLVYLPANDAFLPDPAERDYLRLLPFLPKGIFYTLMVTLLGSLSAIVVGFLVGLGKLYLGPLARTVLSIYTEVLRGVPLLVLLFYIYYALGEFFHMPALLAAVIGFGLCYGAYMADVFRAGIESVPREQGEAARSLGMTPSQALFQIVLPQAMRTLIPAIGNQTLGMLKDTSLVSATNTRRNTSIISRPTPTSPSPICCSPFSCRASSFTWNSVTGAPRDVRRWPASGARPLSSASRPPRQ
jgi:polar amino acid transport system permease protein